MEKYHNSTSGSQPPSGKTVGKSLTAIVLGAISTLYILNPTAGMDLIPDFIPLVGNLDEATAVVILLGCLRYFGLDVTKLLNLARNVPGDAVSTGTAGQRREEKVVSPHDPEVEAARESMYSGKR